MGFLLNRDQRAGLSLWLPPSPHSLQNLQERPEAMVLPGTSLLPSASFPVVAAQQKRERGLRPRSGVCFLAGGEGRALQPHLKLGPLTCGEIGDARTVPLECQGYGIWKLRQEGGLLRV